MKTIPLTQGYETIVDDADYERMSAWRWHAQVQRRKDGSVRYVCARRMQPRPEGGQKPVYFHRELLNTPDGLEVDHTNGNALDNRRENLRICTNAENTRNQKLQVRPGKSSQFKGVRWAKWHQCWRAQIRLRSKQQSLGYFDSEMDAARAYDEAAIRLFGEYARPNFSV